MDFFNKNPIFGRLISITSKYNYFNADKKLAE